MVHRSTMEIAAAWLALGLDTDKVTFYRQSDIPEITELTWFLTCMTAKGLMNRAHAYKAAVQANEEAGEDADFGINMGLFSYPILMAADILMFNAHQIPVDVIRSSMLRWPAMWRLGLIITTVNTLSFPMQWWMTRLLFFKVWMDAR